MATSPIFATTPNIGMGQITTANTARDGTGTLTTIFTAGSSGSRLDIITATASVTTAAGCITLFISNGTNTRFWRDIQVIAQTASTTAPCWVGQVATPLTLPSGYSVLAGATVATGQPFNILAQGANF